MIIAKRMGRPPTPERERFMAAVMPVPESGCWLWLGTLQPDGYGKFQKKKSCGRWTAAIAHRVAYEHFVGTIPAGLEIDHLCRVKCCVNPTHLEAVTSRTNQERAENWIYMQGHKIHCRHGHEFDARNTYRWGGSRYCRTCNRAAARKYLSTRSNVNDATR